MPDDTGYPTPLDELHRLRAQRRLALSCARQVAADPSYTGRPGWPNHAAIATHEAAIAEINRVMEATNAR